jgi:hypothetical protein
MTTHHTPHSAAAEVAAAPSLPSGEGDRVSVFGVMGLPFASGHYLALRDLPAASFLPPDIPGYRSVWHRDPAGVWTFYATTPGPLSCARYFSSATSVDAVQCPIDMHWVDDYTLTVSIPDVLRWTVAFRDTVTTRLLSRVATALPERAWTSGSALGLIGRSAGTLLGAGQIRLAGAAPNGQRFRVAPTRMWAVGDSSAALDGIDLGLVEPLPEQARLADFRLPQRGLGVVGQARFTSAPASAQL